MPPRAIVVTTLAYVFRDESLLLMLRRKQPNLGLWSPPGGKVEPGESPMDAALRELREETGLVGTSGRLAAVVAELDESSGDAWLMFAVEIAVPEGEPRASHPEGDSQWVALSQLAELDMPPADPYILAAVLYREGGVPFLAVRFDGGRLVDVRTAVAGEATDTTAGRGPLTADLRATRCGPPGPRTPS